MHNQNSSRFDTKPVNKIILFILVGLSVYALYTIFNNSKTKENDNLVFENNLKCAKFIDQENARVGQIPFASLPAVYYSPKLKTCVSSYIVMNTQSNYSSYFIDDILTNNSIFSTGGPTGSDIASKSFDTYIIKERELKGLGKYKSLDE